MAAGKKEKLPASRSSFPRLQWRETPVLALAALGVFVAALDQTAVVTLLPDMINGIGLPADRFYRAAWIVNAYILGYIVAMPLMARVSDAVGHGRIFALSLLVFMAGSAGVALSRDLTALSIARGVQAIGGGAVVPVSMAMVLESAPLTRRAVGLGAMAAASEAGGLLGPLWGGLAGSLLGWSGVFWINIPLCLPIAFAVWRLHSWSKPGRAAMDWPGILLLAGSLVALTIALTDDPIEPRPEAESAALYVAAALLFGAFLLRQTRARLPIVDPALLRRLPVVTGFFTNLLTGGALIVAMVSVPLFTNVVLQESALSGGLNLMRLTVALPVGAVLGGYATQRFGFRPVIVGGLLLTALGFAGMSRWSEDPGLLIFTLPLLLAGLGFGLVIAPVNDAVLESAAEGERATLASLLVVLRLIGALVGVALLTTQGLGGFYHEAGLVPLDDPNFVRRIEALQLHTFRDTFLATAAVCLLAALPALLLSEKLRARADAGAP